MTQDVNPVDTAQRASRPPSGDSPASAVQSIPAPRGFPKIGAQSTVNYAVQAPSSYAEAMPYQTEASNLVAASVNVFGRPVELEAPTAQAWMRMRALAEKDGIRLLLLSGFRSVQRQWELLEKKLKGGTPLEEVLRQLAFPGHSEHHTGRAIDVGSPDCEHLTEAFGTTREFAWMVRSAGRFGFRLSYPKGNAAGIAYEPWNWFFTDPTPTESVAPVSTIRDVRK